MFCLDSLTLFSPNSLLLSFSCQPRASEVGRMDGNTVSVQTLVPRGTSKVRLYTLAGFCCLSQVEQMWEMEVVKHQKFNKWLRSSLKQTPAQYYQSKNYSFTGNSNSENYMSSEVSLNRNIRNGKGCCGWGGLIFEFPSLVLGFLFFQSSGP